MPLKHPSNFTLLVEAHDFADFERALRIAFDDYGHAPQKAKYFKKDKGTIFLFWSKEEQATDLPYPMSVEEAIPFLWNWLKSVDTKDMENCPDIDGSVEPDGWRVEAGSGWYTIVKVTKVWSLYHK